MKRLLLTLCFIIIISNFVMARTADNLIQPGISVGSAYLGKTTTKDIVNWLGNPEKTTKNDKGDIFYIYDTYGLTFIFTSSILSAVIITSNYYKTPELIGIGSTTKEVVAAYPYSKSTYYKEEWNIVDANKNTVYYCNSSSGTVFRILIMLPQ